MPLTKTGVSFPFQQGLDTKTDPKSVLPGKLLQLQNALFTKPGRLNKRNGFTSMSGAVSTFGAQDRPGSFDNTIKSTIQNGRAVMGYRDELLALDPTYMYSYGSTGQQWFPKGTIASGIVKTNQVSQSNAEQLQQSLASNASGLQAFVWQESTTCYYSIIDSTTGQTIKNRGTLSANAAIPKVVTVGNTFIFFWVNTSSKQVYSGTLPIASPTQAITTQALTGVIVDDTSLSLTKGNIDVDVINEDVYLAFNNRVGTASVWQFTNNDYLNPYARSVTNRNSDGPLTVFASVRDTEIGVVTVDGTDLYWSAFSIALLELETDLLLHNDTTDLVSITGISSEYSTTTDHDFKVFYSYVGATDGEALTRVATVAGPYVTLTVDEAVLLRSVALASKAFGDSDGYFLTLAHKSTLQPTFFISDVFGTIVGKVFGGNAGITIDSIDGGGPFGDVSLPSVWLVDGVYRLALRNRIVLDSEDGTILSNPAVAAASFDLFDAAQSYQHAELGDNLHVSGGLLSMYDGDAPVEHGFNLFPEDVEAVSDDPGSAFTYQYSVCYEWTDARGQIHRSAPSPGVTLTSDTAIGTSETQLSIPTLRVTSKENVRIVIYRTINNGIVFYRLTDVGEIANDTATDFVVYNDDLTDANLIDEPLLYTTGGILENIQAPPTAAICTHRNRIFLVDSSRPLSVWFSKERSGGEPVQFSDLLYFNVSPEGGPVTGLASLDDKLLIFKERQIFVITGRGPDSTGANSDFSDTILVTTDVGCIEPKSIVSTPAGVMFRSNKGIYQISRGLSAEYIGANCESNLGSASVTSSVLAASQNHVRFTLDNRTALVYDYFVGQWSVFTNISAVDSMIWDGEHTFIRSSGRVLREQPGVFSDDGAWITLSLKTSWLSFATLAGFQRVTRAYIVSQFEGDHKMNIGLAYDFDPAITQTVSVTADGTTYGEGTYGDESPYGGGAPLCFTQIYPARQKCSALQMTISDAPTSSGSTANQGLSLSGIRFEVGSKSGSVKLGTRAVAV